MFELGVEQRDEILSMLTIEQRGFLDNELFRSRRTIFAKMMAQAKGAHIPPDATFEEIEYLLDSWVYTGYYDAGHVSADLLCECGRPLRYQHVVQHKESGQVLKFGMERENKVC